MKLPDVPIAPGVDVQRFDANGKPTPAQVTYEKKVEAFLKAVKAAVEQA